MFLIDLLIRFWHSLKSFLIRGASLRHPSMPSQRQPAKVVTRTGNNNRERKGDPSLLSNKEAVSLRTAELYLGISERQRQKLTASGALDARGRGSDKQITTESLRRYLPPRNREPKRTNSDEPHRSEPKRT